MKISQVMEVKVRTVGARDTLVEAARRMKWFSVGALPVVEDGKLVGMLTDRDIVTRVVSEGLKPAEVPCSVAMTRGAQVCRSDADILDAFRMMEEHGIHHLVVVDAFRRVVGIVSQDDLFSAPEEEAAAALTH